MCLRIRELREDNDFNQTSIAAVLSMSQTGYSKYETGENDIALPVLINLSFFYNTSLEYLLGISDDKTLPRLSESQIKRYTMYREAFQKLYAEKHPRS